MNFLKLRLNKILLADEYWWEQDLTLEVSLVSSVRSVANHQAGRMNHNLPAAPQLRLNLPGAPSLLQSQGKPVVVATEADQDPQSHVHSVTGELERVSAVSQVGTHWDVTVTDLKSRKVKGGKVIKTCKKYIYEEYINVSLQLHTE